MPSTNTGAAAGETYQSIEDLLGSQGDDTILGDASANTLFGYDGNDTIWGRNGNDSLRGGDGNDNLIGGRDVDTYVGGNGTDRVQYQDFAAGLRVDLLYPYTNTGAAAGETFISIENLLGSQGNDFVLGDHNANQLLGYHGNDTIYGRGGDDSLQGGDGNDVLIGNGGVDTYVGGNGTDRVQYQDITASLRADLLNPSANTGEAAGETFNSIEDLLGSQSDDTILGDDNANDLFGYYGDDIIFGRGGNDILRGNDGADQLNGGAGNDILLGGADVDTFYFDGTDFGMDRIIDFDITSETIDLTAYAGLTFGDLTIGDVGGRAEVSFAFGDIVLTGIVAADVTSGIFDFAP
jgi:serralysin